MDLNTVTSYRFARSRDDLALAPGEIILGGGTWLFSEPQPAVTGLVDLTTMGWPDLEVTDAGLASPRPARSRPSSHSPRVAVPPVPDDWAAASVVPRAPRTPCSARSRSGTPPPSAATSAPRSAPASMISLASALDGEA